MAIAINTTPKVLTRVQIKLDYSGDVLVYVGESSEGTLTSVAGWLINKLVYTGSKLTSVVSAIGSWDNRASLIYS